jgi:hypothetical protein
MIPPKKATGPSREQRKYIGWKIHRVTEYTEKQFQKYFVPGKNTATDESTTGFKGKIILKA